MKQMNETKSRKQDKYEDDVDMPMSTTTTTTTTTTLTSNNSNRRVNVEQTETKITTNDEMASNDRKRNVNANRNKTSKGESIDNVNDKICDCITCQRALYCCYVPQRENDNKNESGNNVFAEYARQCMYRECGTRDKNASNMECENCSQVSCCRGCNIILCKKCRKLLNVLQCSYNDYDNNNNNNNNTNTSNKNDKQSEKKENKNENNNNDKNDKNDNNEDNDNCNTFICSQACYKKILFKYNIMLRFNGLDSSLHVSIIQFKKLFMKPYLSGLYQSLMLPDENEYKMMIADMNNNNSENAILVNWNDINWEYVDKQDWFPFHECQECKKHNCGCTDWTCCVHCRKYYCQECVDKKLHKCKLDECENFTCCQWEMWDKNCMYCNDYGKCQLIFCTKGHCDTHFIP